MSTIYRLSLQKRISSLTAEYAQLERQQAAAVASLSAHPTPEQKRRHMREWLASSEELRKVGQRLRHAKRLLARAKGDEYVFQKS